jgi:hypothetical protein
MGKRRSSSQPSQNDEDHRWEVCAIEDKRRGADGVEYYVKWKGDYENSWEPVDLLLHGAEEAIAKFEERALERQKRQKVEALVANAVGNATPTRPLLADVQARGTAAFIKKRGGSKKGHRRSVVWKVFVEQGEWAYCKVPVVADGSVTQCTSKIRVHAGGMIMPCDRCFQYSLVSQVPHVNCGAIWRPITRRRRWA